MIALLLLLLAGCASQPEWYSDAGTGETPETWQDVSEIVAIVTGEEGQPLGALRLKIESEAIDACGQPMTRARLVSDTSGIVPEAWYRTGAIPSGYLVHGDLLYIVLNAPICDDNYDIRAKLVDSGAAGYLFWSSPWGGKDLGRVAIAIVK